MSQTQVLKGYFRQEEVSGSPYPEGRVTEVDGDEWGEGLDFDLEDGFYDSSSDSYRNLAVLQQGHAQGISVEADDTMLGDLDSYFADGGGSDLKTELQNLISQVQNNLNLTEEDRQKFLHGLNEIQSQMAANPTEEDFYALEERFFELQSQFTVTGAHAAPVTKLSDRSGMDPVELEKLFEKYGIDASKEIKLPNSNVERLLNDPSFGELQSLRDEVKQKYSAFEQRVKDLRKGANAWNALEKADRDTTNAVDDSFKDLYEESIGEGDGWQEVQSALTKLNQKTADILSALTGKSVTLSNEADEAGMMVLDGRTFHAIENLESPQIKLHSGDIKLPEVELVPLTKDVYGDGKTEVPEWMKEVDYPTEDWDEATTWEKVWGTIKSPFVDVYNSITDPVGSVKKVFNKVKDTVSKLKFW